MNNELQDHTQKTILVIEDESIIRETLKIFLESEGYAVLLAENGKDALEQLGAGAAPDLILLDMKMPVMDGKVFAAQYARTHDRSVPVILMTAANCDERKSEEFGAVGCIAKPFDLDELLRVIRAC